MEEMNKKQRGEELHIARHQFFPTERNKLISDNLYKGNSIIRYCSMKGKVNRE